MKWIPPEPVARAVDEALRYEALDPAVPGTIAGRLQVLGMQRDRRLLDIAAVTHRRRAPVLTRQAALSTDLELERAAHHSRVEQRTHLAQHAEAWRRAGIQDRLATPVLPAAVHLLLIGVLGALDFYVFALVVAKSDDVRVDPRQPLFLLGGVLGLTVFGFGLLLAHLLKGVVYARVQARLRSELDRGELALADGVDARQLVPSRTSRLLIVTMSVVFALFLGFRVALRWEVLGPHDDPSLALLQSLIPLLALGVECYFHDPTVVPAVRPRRRLRKLARQQALIDDELRRIATEDQAERAQAEHTYAAAETLLRLDLTS